jgi:hypothetical protein
MPARRAPLSCPRPVDDHSSPASSRRSSLLAFGATLLRHVPNAALGGVLLFVALRIIRFRQIVAIYRQSFGEFLLIVSTTAAIIVLPIEQGAAIGIALSLLNVTLPPFFIHLELESGGR